MGTRGSPPYHGVVTPGWTLDEKGQAMSKSRGNDVDPVDIASRLGGEIVRLWVASVDFREDVVGSEPVMQRVAESYRKIRNSLFRYVLSNLYDFDPQQHAVPFDEMDILDQYMLRQTVAMAADVTRWYDEFAFHKIYHRINDFCVVELSAFYFDVLKDRLYTYAPNSRARRAAQTAIWHIGEALVRLLAPITSFTCDEVWQYLPALPDRPASVHLANFPSASDILGGAIPADDPKQREDWTTLLACPHRSTEGPGRGPAEQADRRRQSGGTGHGDGRRARVLRPGALPGPAPLSVYRVGGHSAAGQVRKRHQRSQRPGEQGRGQEVRTLLELLDPRGRGRRLSHGVRALQRRVKGDRRVNALPAAGKTCVAFFAVQGFHHHE